MRNPHSIDNTQAICEPAEKKGWLRATETEPLIFSPNMAEVLFQIGAISQPLKREEQSNCRLITNVNPAATTANPYRTARSRDLIAVELASRSTITSTITQVAI